MSVLPYLTREAVVERAVERAPRKLLPSKPNRGWAVAVNHERSVTRAIGQVAE